MKWRVLGKMTSFHLLFTKKKEARNGAVLTALWVFFFPWTREAGEEDFSSPYFHRLSSSKKHQKDADQGHPLAQKAFHVLDGRQHSGRPSHVSLPCFCL
jgi:hypothetical protein